MDFTSKVRSAFVAYLRREKLLDEESLSNALERQRTETPQIGRLALEQRLLNMRQVFHILEKQTQTGKLFGEQAVDLGYIDDWHVSMLLQLQRESRPPISEGLLQMELCSSKELEQWREAFLQNIAQFAL